MLDALAMEAAGLPTITIIGDRFEPAARLHAEAGGMPDLPFLIEPTTQDTTVTSDGAAIARAHVDEVVRALSHPTGGLP